MRGAPLFIVPSVAVGGAEVQLMQQLAGLRRRGIAPRLMVLSNRVEPDLLAEAGLPPAHVAILGLASPVLEPAFLRGCPAALVPAARFAARAGCTRAVALLPPAHFFGRLLKLALLARGRRMLLYQYHHSEEVRLNPADTCAKRLFLAGDRLLAPLCDHAHWHVSEAVKADITAAMVTRRDAVLHNTCDMDSPGDPEAAAALLGGSDGFKILLPGRLHAVKGHALLVEAAARLAVGQGLGPAELRLIFAGEGPERERIAAAVAAAGLREHVTMLGSVPHPVLLALYRLVDLVAVPSLSEGFGIVAIEAMSRGALLVASDAAGLDEIVRPGVNALQFPAGDGAALAALLEKVWRCRGAGLIDRGILNAEMTERFGIERHLDCMLALLEGVDG